MLTRAPDGSRAAVSSPDNGSCFRAADFARHLRARPEFRHVRTRVKGPETNGQIERFFQAIKYEHLYRHEISDGLELEAHIDSYLDTYNLIRPHEAIAFARPIDAYLTNPDTLVPTRATPHTRRRSSRRCAPSPAASRPAPDRARPAAKPRPCAW